MVESHAHNGVDNQEILFEDLDITAQAALTAKNTSTLSTGGSAVLSASDSAVIDNNRTRIEQLELRLQNLGLLE